MGLHVEAEVGQEEAVRHRGVAQLVLDTSDKRVNSFYYPIDTWADFIFFNFCMDRGASHQLEDVRAGSYGP